MSMVQVQVDPAVDQGYCSLSEKKDGIPEEPVVAESSLSQSLEGAPGLLMFPKSRLKRSSSPNILAPSMLRDSNASIDSNDGVSLRAANRNSELRKSWRKSLSTALTSMWSPPPTTKEESLSSPTSDTTTTTADKFTFDYDDIAMTTGKDASPSNEPWSVEEKKISSSTSDHELRSRSNSSLARRKYGISYPKSASCGDGLSSFLERIDSGDGSPSTTTDATTTASESNNNTKVTPSESFKSKKRGSIMSGFRRRRSSRRNSDLCDSQSDFDERLSSVSSGSPVLPKISDSEIFSSSSSSAPTTPMPALARRASKTSNRGSTLSLFFQKAKNKSMSKACSERDLSHMPYNQDAVDGSDESVKSSTRQRLVSKFKSRSNKNDQRHARGKSTTSLPDMVVQRDRHLSFDAMISGRDDQSTAEDDERSLECDEAKDTICDSDVTMVSYRKKSNDDFFRSSSVDNLSFSGTTEEANKTRLKKKAFRKSLKNFVSFNKW